MCKIRYHNTSDFVKHSRDIHGDKYDYSELQYTGWFNKVKIICRKCQYKFLQQPQEHIAGCGCPKCANNIKLTTEEYVKKAKKVHGKKYNYSLVDYKVGKSKITIKCNKCEDYFIQRADHHLRGSGCPVCNISKGEEKIKKYLQEHKIKFSQQKKFNNCRGNARRLPFDFYIPRKNMLIEYDGIQHFKPTEKFGGEEAYRLRKIYDTIKTTYAEQNNINLLRIPYTNYDKIEKILKETL